MNKVLTKLQKRPFHTTRAFWYVKRINTAEILPESPPSDATVKIVIDDYHNLAAWLKKQAPDYPWIYNQREIEYAGKYGHLYSSIYYQGEIAGYVKVALLWAYIEDYEGEIPLETDEAFIYDTFTIPKFQKKHFATKLLSEVLRYLGTSTVAFVYCHIPEWNTASRRLYQKLGFQKIAQIRYLRIMKWKYFSNNPVAIKAKGRAACLGT